jgi:hypothetical protein
MTVRINSFNFFNGDDAEVEVRFGLPSSSDDAMRFLSALGAFVSNYGSKQIPALPMSDESKEPHAVETAEAVQPAPATKSRARRSAPPAPPAPEETKPVDNFGEETAAVAPPTVTETVVPARDPKAASAPAVATTDVVSSPAPAPREAVRRVATPAPATPPKAPTGASSAPSAGASQTTLPTVDGAAIARVPVSEIPADLMAAKSFKNALVWLLRNGYDSAEKLTRACYMYGDVPCIGRYLEPSPDPEMAIERRVARAFEVLGGSSA